MIRLGGGVTVDTENRVAYVLGREVELKEVEPDSVPALYREPFADGREPDAWLCIDGNQVIVKVKERFFVGVLPSR